MEHSFPLRKAYATDRLSAREAQLRARFIAWGPAIFQATRIMLKRGILEMLRDHPEGLSRPEICGRAGLGDYAVKCLLEASLCIGTILLDADTGRYKLSKTGWFMLVDPANRVDMDFNHDVNYEGWFRLEESFVSGRPEGLGHFGDWPTVYEALSSLPEQVQESWFAFDHFYSDHSFDEALHIVFDAFKPRSLFDIGGNTGRWALRCVGYDKEVRVTIFDLPQQIETMRRHVSGKPGSDRIDGYGINLLDGTRHFPAGRAADAVWMSQFLDCFSMEEIVSILKRASEVMSPSTRLFIMETLWDRQKYEPAALALTMTSLYFAAIANGNSKMYGTEDLCSCIEAAGLAVEDIHDGLGHGHSILVCKLKKQEL